MAFQALKYITEIYPTEDLLVTVIVNDILHLFSVLLFIIRKRAIPSVSNFPWPLLPSLDATLESKLVERTLKLIITWHHSITIIFPHPSPLISPRFSSYFRHLQCPLSVTLSFFCLCWATLSIKCCDTRVFRACPCLCFTL